MVCVLRMPNVHSLTLVATPASRSPPAVTHSSLLPPLPPKLSFGEKPRLLRLFRIMTTRAPSCHCGEPHPFVRLIAICLALFFASCYTPTAQAQAKADLKSVDVPAGDALTTLKELSSQVGGRLLYTTESVSGVQTRAVKGQMTAAEALEIMLADTGLVAVSDPKTGAVAVRRENEAEVKNVSRAIAEGSGRPGQSVKNENVGGEEVVKMPEYMVTGRKSLNTDIRRTIDDPQPYVVFDRRDIESSQSVNLEDFFRKRLTMNAQQQTGQQTTVGIAQPTTTSQINLRGFGLDETLILVDGRRAPRVLLALGGSGPLTQADVNGIPLSAIERIEVLPSTAGGFYGGGATGGVINIIRKRDYRGIELILNHGGSLSGGGETYRSDVSGGVSLNKGKTRFNFTASFARSTPLYTEDNDLWSRSRALYLSNLPSATAQGFSLGPILGYTTNIKSATPGAILTLKSNGQSLGSDHTSIPIGYAGVATDQGAALVVNAGTYNLELSNDSAGRFAPLSSGPVIKAANVSFSHEFSDRVEAFLDINYSGNSARTKDLIAATTISLQASATNNPFNQAITVAVPAIGLERPFQSDSTSYSANAGIIVRLRGDWTASAEYTRSEARINSTRYAALDPTLAEPAYQSGPLNPIRDVNEFPLDFSPYLVGSNSQLLRTGPTKSGQQVFSGRISGTTFEMPAGGIVMSALVENRRELASEYSSFSGPSNTTFVVPVRSQSVDSGYMELRVPVVGSRNPLPIMQSFELQASIRHDRYTSKLSSPTSYLASVTPPAISTVVQQTEANSYTVAAALAPVQDLSIRVSHSKGFLPPNINQLVSTQGTLTVRDPLRGNAITPVSYGLSQGNPELRPENSKSMSIGGVISPRLLPRFRVSLDYTRIVKNDEIGNAPSDVLLLTQFFPERVLRAPLTDADRARGFTGGAIQFLDRRLVNLANTRVEVWDLRADYEIISMNRGKFRFYAAATKQTEYITRVIPSAAAVNSVGFRDGPLSLRFNAGLDWIKGNWTVSWNSQYYDDYLVTNSSGTSSALFIAVQGSNRIPSQDYHDLNIQYRFIGARFSLLKNADISVGIENVFNDYPPVMALGFGSSFAGTYSFYGDPRLRRFSLSLHKRL